MVRNVKSQVNQSARRTQSARPSNQPSTKTQVTTSGDNAPQELMKAALGFQEVKINIPDGASLPQMEQYLNTAILGAKRLASASERIRPMIGKLLLEIRNRKLFKPDFKNFTDYVLRRVQGEWGYSKSLAFGCLKQIETFPTLDQTNYESSKLLLAAQVTDESQPNYKEVLDSLSRMTVLEGKAHIKQLKDSSTSERTDAITLSIRVSPATREQWSQMIQDYDMSGEDLLLSCMEAYVEVNPLVTA